MLEYFVVVASWTSMHLLWPFPLSNTARSNRQKDYGTMSSNTSDAQQQQQQMPAEVVTREEFDAVVRQLALARAAQKPIEDQQSSEAAALHFDSVLRQVGTNALQASDDGLKVLSQAW
jgi:hypothetical protein